MRKKIIPNIFGIFFMVLGCLICFQPTNAAFPTGGTTGLPPTGGETGATYDAGTSLPPTGGETEDTYDAGTSLPPTGGETGLPPTGGETGLPPTGGETGTTGTGELSGIELPSGTGLSDKPILTILTTILQWLLEVFLVLAVIAFIITGIQFIVAMGNAYSGAATNAKSNFTNAIIALVVVGAGYIIILTINRLLQGQ